MQDQYLILALVAQNEIMAGALQKNDLVLRTRSTASALAQSLFNRLTQRYRPLRHSSVVPQE